MTKAVTRRNWVVSRGNFSFSLPSPLVAHDISFTWASNVSSGSSLGPRAREFRASEAAIIVVPSLFSSIRPTSTWADREGAKEYLIPVRPEPSRWRCTRALRRMCSPRPSLLRDSSREDGPRIHPSPTLRRREHPRPSSWPASAETGRLRYKESFRGTSRLLFPVAIYISSLKGNSDSSVDWSGRRPAPVVSGGGTCMRSPWWKDQRSSGTFAGAGVGGSSNWLAIRWRGASSCPPESQRWKVAPSGLERRARWWKRKPKRQGDILQLEPCSCAR